MNIGRNKNETTEYTIRRRCFRDFDRNSGFCEYPERPINMIIAYGADGAIDISASPIAAPSGDAVGQALVMSNVTGAGGATGSVAVQNAKGDGYTMLFARVGSHTVSPAMKATLPYTLDDF